MSATQVPLRPIAKGSVTKFWIAMLALVAIGVLVARWGALPFQGVTTDSGVFIQVVEEGEGDVLTDDDGVFIIYTGSIEDGTVFQDTDGRPVPLLVGQAVPGFSEALKTMRPGGKYKIRIPGDQAYGDTPPPDSGIPANADLYFDLEIYEVVRGAASMIAQQPPVPLPPEADVVPAPAE